MGGSRTRGRAIATLLISIAIVVIPFTFYSFFWVEKQREYQTGRKFRALVEASQEFKHSLDNIGDVLRFNIGRGTEPELGSLLERASQILTDRKQAAAADRKALTSQIAEHNTALNALRSLTDSGLQAGGIDASQDPVLTALDQQMQALDERLEASRADSQKTADRIVQASTAIDTCVDRQRVVMQSLAGHYRVTDHPVGSNDVYEIVGCIDRREQPRPAKTKENDQDEIIKIENAKIAGETDDYEYCEFTSEEWDASNNSGQDRNDKPLKCPSELYAVKKSLTEPVEAIARLRSCGNNGDRDGPACASGLRDLDPDQSRKIEAFEDDIERVIVGAAMASRLVADLGPQSGPGDGSDGELERVSADQALQVVLDLVDRLPALRQSLERLRAAGPETKDAIVQAYPELAKAIADAGADPADPPSVRSGDVVDLIGRVRAWTDARKQRAEAVVRLKAEERDLLDRVARLRTLQLAQLEQQDSVYQAMTQLLERREARYRELGLSGEDLEKFLRLRSALATAQTQLIEVRRREVRLKEMAAFLADLVDNKSDRERPPSPQDVLAGNEVYRTLRIVRQDRFLKEAALPASYAREIQQQCVDQELTFFDRRKTASELPLVIAHCSGISAQGLLDAFECEIISGIRYLSLDGTGCPDASDTTGGMADDTSAKPLCPITKMSYAALDVCLGAIRAELKDAPNLPVANYATWRFADIGPLMAPYLAEGSGGTRRVGLMPSEAEFEQILVADDTGQVVINFGGEALSFASLDVLLKSSPADQMLAKQQSKQALAAAEREALRGALSSHSGVWTTRVGDISYRAYVQPFRLAMPELRKVRDEDGLSVEGAHWFIVGLQRESDFARSIASAPLRANVAAVLILIFGILFWPYLKVRLIGDRDVISFADGTVLMAAGFLAAALLTVTILALVDGLTIQDRVDDTAEAIAKDLEHDFQKEIREALTAMDDHKQHLLANTLPFDGDYVESPLLRKLEFELVGGNCTGELGWGRQLVEKQGAENGAQTWRCRDEPLSEEPSTGKRRAAVYVNDLFGRTLFADCLSEFEPGCRDALGAGWRSSTRGGGREAVRRDGVPLPIQQTVYTYPVFEDFFLLDKDGIGTGNSFTTRGIRGSSARLSQRRYFRDAIAGRLWHLPAAGDRPARSFYLERIWTKNQGRKLTAISQRTQIKRYIWFRHNAGMEEAGQPGLEQCPATLDDLAGPSADVQLYDHLGLPCVLPLFVAAGDGQADAIGFAVRARSSGADGRTGDCPAEITATASIRSGTRKFRYCLENPSPAAEPAVLAVTKRTRTLVSPVLPAGFGFAVIESATGNVVFHSRDTRSLVENFYLETDRNRALIAAIKTHRHEVLDADYRGLPHRIYVTPLTGMPLSLAVYYSRNVLDLLWTELIVTSIIVVGIYAAGFVLTMLVIMAFADRNEWGWIWPRKDAHSRPHYFQLILYLGLAVLYSFTSHKHLTGWYLAISTVATTTLAVAAAYITIRPRAAYRRAGRCVALVLSALSILALCFAAHDHLTGWPLAGSALATMILALAVTYCTIRPYSPDKQAQRWVALGVSIVSVAVLLYCDIAFGAPRTSWPYLSLLAMFVMVAAWLHAVSLRLKRDRFPPALWLFGQPGPQGPLKSETRIRWFGPRGVYVATGVLFVLVTAAFPGKAIYDEAWRFQIERLLRFSHIHSLLMFDARDADLRKDAAALSRVSALSQSAQDRFRVCAGFANCGEIASQGTHIPIDVSLQAADKCYTIAELLLSMEAPNAAPRHEGCAISRQWSEPPDGFYSEPWGLREQRLKTWSQNFTSYFLTELPKFQAGAVSAAYAAFDQASDRSWQISPQQGPGQEYGIWLATGARSGLFAKANFGELIRQISLGRRAGWNLSGAVAVTSVTALLILAVVLTSSLANRLFGMWLPDFEYVPKTRRPRQWRRRHRMIVCASPKALDVTGHGIEQTPGVSVDVIDFLQWRFAPRTPGIDVFIYKNIEFVLGDKTLRRRILEELEELTARSDAAAPKVIILSQIFLLDVILHPADYPELIAARPPTPDGQPKTDKPASADQPRGFEIPLAEQIRWAQALSRLTREHVRPDTGHPIPQICPRDKWRSIRYEFTAIKSRETLAWLDLNGIAGMLNAARRDGNRLSETQIVNLVEERATGLYRNIWMMCSRQERLVLHSLAMGNLVNPRDAETIERLSRRGLIVRNPIFTLASRSFAQFVRGAEKPETIRTWRQALPRSAWAAVRVPLLVALLLVGGFIAYVGGEVYETTIGLLTVAATAVPVLLRFLPAARGGS